MKQVPEWIQKLYIDYFSGIRFQDDLNQYEPIDEYRDFAAQVADLFGGIKQRVKWLDFLEKHLI